MNSLFNDSGHGLFTPITLGFFAYKLITIKAPKTRRNNSTIDRSGNQLFALKVYRLTHTYSETRMCFRFSEQLCIVTDANQSQSHGFQTKL